MPKKELMPIEELLMRYDLDGMIKGAKTLDREFVIHSGPTNSGKTYAALQALKAANTGVYLGPLRLLALEVFDDLNDDGIPCDLLTGEERIEVPGAAITASTIEMCDITEKYDVAVIDEAQLIADRVRGGSWTRALMKVNAKVVHVCCAPEAEGLLCRIIRNFGKEPTVIHHERLTPLVYGGSFHNIKEVQPGDCLIAFSRKKVLSIAAALENEGIPTSVIYGALPPDSRRNEVHRFADSQSKVVVATDAIGMGVSLPIRRVIFAESYKFDGTQRRTLNPEEVRQIAGRAGRFGIYDEGQFLGLDNPALIQQRMKEPVEQIRKLVIPFPVETLASEYSVKELLTVWQQRPHLKGADRVNMETPLILHNYLARYKDELSKYDLYKFICCPVDTKSNECISFWLACCRAIIHNTVMPVPEVSENTLAGLEIKYKCYDILHQMGQYKLGFVDKTLEEKRRLSDSINERLRADKSVFLARCSICNKPLPLNHSYGVCDKCYQRRMERFDWW